MTQSGQFQNSASGSPALRPRQVPVPLWTPGLAFASVSSIVVGSLWPLGNLAQLLVFIAKANDSFESLYNAVPTLGVWKWCGPVWGLGAGLFALLGGVSGVQRRYTARLDLRRAVFIALGWWLAGVVVWGLLGSAAFDVAYPSQRVYQGFRPTPYGSPAFDPVVVKEELLASMICSSLVVLAWGLSTLKLISTRSLPGEACAAMPAGAPLPVEPHPVLEATAAIPYRSRGAVLDAGRSLELQAPPPLARAIFMIAIALGAVQGMSGFESLYSRPQLTNTLAMTTKNVASYGPNTNLYAALDVASACVALALLIGGVLALLRVAAGRVLILISVAVLLAVAFVHFRIGLTEAINVFFWLPSSFSLGYVQRQTSPWRPLIFILDRFVGAAIFPIICFVALSRKPR